MSELKHIRFIVNPISGIGKQKVVPQWAEELIDKKRFTYDIHYTEAPKHAIDLSKKAAAEGVHIVAIVGGDGSVNEAGSALLGSDTALAIIPTGSGNGLAHHLGIPINPQQAIAMLNHHKVKAMDTGTLNGHTFVGVAGIGFDALIAYEFSRFGKRGFFSYFKIVLREYFNYEEEEYHVISDQEEVTAKAFLLTIANSSQYGNRATIAPKAEIDDGLLKLCLLRKFSWFQAPFVAWRLFSGNIDKSRFMKVLEGKQFKINKSNVRAHIDGEPIQLEENIVVEVIPNSLKVIVPA